MYMLHIYIETHTHTRICIYTYFGLSSQLPFRKRLPDSLEEVLRLKARATLETSEKILKDEALVPDSFGDSTSNILCSVL